MGRNTSFPVITIALAYDLSQPCARNPTRKIEKKDY